MKTLEAQDMGAALVELAVVLVANSNDPSVLNPDFLIHNGIVDGGAEISSPAVSTPVFSQVRFKDGVVVTADPERIVFSSSNPLDDAPAAPRIARRYLQRMSHALYRAVGINPKFVVRPTDPGVEAALRDRGEWMSFNGVAPKIFLKFVYSCGDRTISLDVAGAYREGDGTALREKRFQANVHRDLTETNSSSRNQRLGSVLDAWERDVDDVRRLIGKFRQEE